MAAPTCCRHLVVAFLMASSVAAATSPVLWYQQPAAQWTDALPIGNGRLGAMVFGRVSEERIQLNEDTVWAGEVRDRMNPAAPAAVPEIRRLLLAGKIAEAQNLAEQAMISIPRRMPPYQPLGDLTLTFPDAGPMQEYRRELDLDRALASTTYQINGVRYRREVFASAVDQVIVIRLTCDRPGKLSFDATLTRAQDSQTRTVAPDQVVLTGEAITRDDRHPGERKVGVHFAAALRAIADGGSVSAEGDHLKVQNANSVTLLLAAATNVRVPGDLVAASQRQLAAASARPYPQLLAAHIEDHRRLFRRVSLQLGPSNSSNDDLPTDERLRRMQQGGEDLGLLAQYFQFGRYLLIASSRPGTMPANLQGIWNESLSPSWDSKYTININTEMNYWPAEVANLSELHEPLFDLIERIRKPGQRTAQRLYGAGGFVAHHNTDLWGDVDPIDGARYGVWPMGAAWLSLHLWEHYDFTRDREFLARRGYPLMKEAAQFLLDYLFDDGHGRLVTGPSISPENTYILPDGTKGFLCLGPYMDTEITDTLFRRVIESSRILGVDAEFRSKLASVRDRLPPLRIGKHGQLQEWIEDYDEAEPGHRHISHLFALHPGDQISPHRTPDLARAARVTLERRLKNGGGHTGWSRAWIINFWARLEDGEKAYENVLALLRKSTLPNLFDNHPPFQIDGNFGGTAGMVEMLVQSHAGEISLLPALPKAWAEGSAHGLHARGAVELDLDWSSGRLTNVTLRPAVTGPITLRLPAGQQIATVGESGKKVPFKTKNGVTTLTLTEGHPQQIAFKPL